MSKAVPPEHLGIPPIDPQKYPKAFAEIHRIAHRLRQTGCRSIGFAPADDQVGAVALAVQLAFAFARQHNATCNVLDANIVRPQFSHIQAFAGIPADASGFRTVRIAKGVTLSTPTTIANRLIFADIARVTQRAKRRYDYVFVDLTGLVYSGEHSSAYDLLDGVAVVARTDKTFEKDIRFCVDDIPPDRCLGVVLVG